MILLILINIKDKERKLDFTDRFEIIRETALGVQAIHSKNIIHRDIKPQNVLLIDKVTKSTNMINPKLSDYGESYDFNSEEYKWIINNKDNGEKDFCDTYSGTIKYAPPEIISGRLDLQSKKSDIFSLGVLIWEVFTEKTPFEGIDNDELSENAMDFIDKINEDYEPLKMLFENGAKYHEGTPVELGKLVEKCLKPHVEERPDIEEIIDEIEKIQKDYHFNYTNK